MRIIARAKWLLAGLIAFTGAYWLFSAPPRWVSAGHLVVFRTLSEMIGPADIVVLGTFEPQYSLLNIAPLEVEQPEHPSYVAVRECHVTKVFAGEKPERMVVAQRVVRYGRPDVFVGMDEQIYHSGPLYLVIASKSQSSKYWWIGPQRAFRVIDDKVYSRDLTGETYKGATITTDGVPLEEFLAQLLAGQ